MLGQFGPVSIWSESTLDSIVERGIGERRSIEYKAKLPGKAYEEVREFLADVSSFVSAGGRHILFGIAASDGVPAAIVPSEDGNPGGTKLRLENILRDNISPRLLGATLAGTSRANGALKTWLLTTNTNTSSHNQQTFWVLSTRLPLGNAP